MTEHSGHISHAGHSDSPAYELEFNSLGMWIFLAGELMFFGVILTGYTVYRFLYADAFAEASRHLDITLGTINTALLLLSSFTMALAVNAIQRGNRRLMVLLLLATMLLGSAFLGIKGLEYSHKIQEGLFPGPSFTYDAGGNVRHIRLFFSLYFIMTGLHAAHMIIGVVVMGVVAVLGLLGRYSAERFVGVELLGLYWHFVDIVWIFLFPLLYLIERT